MDDAIQPSFLSVTTSGSEPSGYARGVDDPYLRVGRISKVYKPTDDANQSKKFIEYDVEADIWEASGSYTKITFPRARMVSLFGAVGDFSHHTPRVVTSNPNTINQGSLVLVLCVNGDTRQAIIIGGVQHPSLPKENPEQDGHNFQAEFNGVNTSINNDGELIVTYNGPTQADGSPDPASGVNDSNTGQTISMTKDGSVTLTSPDALQQVQINNGSHEVNITSDHGMNLSSSGQVAIQSAGVLTGAATDQVLLGSTYRFNEMLLHQEIVTITTTLTNLMTIAAAQLSAAGAAMVVPITGAVTAAPLIAAAGAAMTSAVASLTAWTVAVQTFETTNNVTPYLSDVNYTD